MNYDYAVHSDFLIHWTGKDIDRDYDPLWYQSDKSKTNDGCSTAFIKRLSDILQYGIWMTEKTEITDSPIMLNGISIDLPPTPKSCFTELKLSESRKHAKLYGRLGIGVKRPFLFNHFGRPMIYYGYHNKSAVNDLFLTCCAHELASKNLFNYFKPMNSTTILDYDFYSESEWRIIFFEELIKRKLIMDPKDPKNIKEHAYYQSLTPGEQNKLKYLIPLDGWFAMIIYPSLQVKNLAQKDLTNVIQSEIKRIKTNPDHANRVENGNWPIEINLDACRNF